MFLLLQCALHMYDPFHYLTALPIRDMGSQFSREEIQRTTNSTYSYMKLQQKYDPAVRLYIGHVCTSQGTVSNYQSKS